MASKPIVMRTIPYPLGTCNEDQWCPRAVQAELAVDSNGAPVVQTTPIVVGNVGGGAELLAYPPGIALQQQIREEELVLWCEVPLDEQDSAQCSSLACYQNNIVMY